MSFSVVIPTYNEKDSITKVLKEVKSAVPEAEIIVVDDYSTDGTADIVKSLNDIKLVCHSENRGAMEAVVSGIKSAKHEVVVTIDADGQHPIELIPAIVKAVLRDEADIVMGVRPKLPRLGERIIAFAAGVSDATTGFRVVKRNMAEMLQGDQAYGGMFIARAKKQSLRISEFPISVKPRQTGRSFHSDIKVLLRACNFLFNRGDGSCG